MVFSREGGGNALKILKTKQLTGQSGGDLFRLLANCFVLFCSDLAVLTFPTHLADIQRHNKKSAYGFRGREIQFLNLLPPLLFTLIFLQWGIPVQFFV